MNLNKINIKFFRLAIIFAFALVFLLGMFVGSIMTVSMTGSFLNHALEGTNLNIVVDINETALTDAAYDKIQEDLDES